MVHHAEASRLNIERMKQIYQQLSCYRGLGKDADTALLKLKWRKINWWITSSDLQLDFFRTSLPLFLIFFNTTETATLVSFAILWSMSHTLLHQLSNNRLNPTNISEVEVLGFSLLSDMYTLLQWWMLMLKAQITRLGCVNNPSNATSWHLYDVTENGYLS